MRVGRAAAAALAVVMAGNWAVPAAAYHGEDMAVDKRVLAADTVVDAGLVLDCCGRAVLLANNEDFADALAAASGLESPDLDKLALLFTSREQVPEPVMERIEAIYLQNDAKIVYLLGGAVAISPLVELQLRERGFEPVRLSGPTRVETAVAVAERFWPAGQTRMWQDGKEAVLVRGFGEGTAAFADALTASTYAVGVAPVLLTEQASLSMSTADYLRRRGFERVTVIGGRAAVSDAVVTQVRELGVTVRRLSGPDRYATARAVAEDMSRGDAVRLTRIFLVDGESPLSWASGFAVGGQAGTAMRGHNPMNVTLLTRGREVPAATRDFLARVDGSHPPGLTCTPFVDMRACDEAARLMEAGRGHHDGSNYL